MRSYNIERPFFPLYTAHICKHLVFIYLYATGHSSGPPPGGIPDFSV
jgi:hypothetical protein